MPDFNLIKIEKNDSEKVRLLVQLGNKIKLTDTTESWRCQKSIDSLAKKTGNEYFAGQGNFLKGTLMISTQNFAALGILEKAIQVFS